MTDRIRFVVGLCAIVSGCSSSASMGPRTPPTDHDLQGSWGEPFPPGGSTFIMSLAESSGVVHGTGSFAGEAAPYGSLAVSGTIANGTALLQVVFNFEPNLFPTLGPDTGQFVGQLITTDSIAGQLTVSGRTSIVPLIRLRINDPP